MAHKGKEFRTATVGRYMFSIQEMGTATFVGDAPEGARFDVVYDSDDSSFAYTKVPQWLEDWGDDLGNPPMITVTAPQGECKALDNKTELGALRETLGYRVAALQALYKDKLPDLPKSLGTQNAAIDKFAAILVEALRKGKPSKLGYWLGFDAQIVSGSDWTLVRSDGVAELSGRVTFKSNDQSDQALVNMVVTGSVDLNGAEGGQPEAQFLAAVKTGLPFAVAATFEAGRTAPSWAPNGMQRQASGFWKYQALTRAQFLLVGVVSLSGSETLGTGWDIGIKVEADVFEVRRSQPGKPQPAPEVAPEAVSS